MLLPSNNKPIQQKSSPSSKARQTIVSSAVAVSAIIGSGAFAQDLKTKTDDRPINPSHMAYVHPEIGNGKIIVSNRSFVREANPTNMSTVSSKFRDIGYPPEVYQKVVAIRERTQASFEAYDANPTEGELQKLHSIFLEWRDMELTSANYYRGGLVNRIRGLLVLKGYKLPPV